MSASSRLLALARRLPPLGVRARLLLLMVALGLPFMAHLVQSLRQSHAAEREHVQREVRDLAQLTTARLNDKLGDTRVLVTTLGLGVGPAVGDAHRVNALLQSLSPDLPGYIDNLSVWSREGRLVATLHAADGAPATSIAGQPWFKDALRTGQPAYQAPVLSRLRDESVAVIASPWSVAGELAGVVVVTIRLEQLTGLLDPDHSLPPGAVITVIDEAGMALARSIDARQWIGRQVAQGDEARAAAVAADEGHTFERRSIDGVSRLFGYARVKGLPWLVYVGVPADLVMAPVNARLRESLVFGGAMLGLGLLLALWTGERIARPLHQLAIDAQAIGRGDLAHRSQVTGVSEIGLLADTLNRMAESLQQRAQALAASKQLLNKVTDGVPALLSLLDREERFRFANLAYADRMGVDPGSLIGRSLLEVYGPQPYEQMRPYLQAAWSGQHAVFERPMATTPSRGWVEVTFVPRLGEDGQIQELCVMILDVTERHLAQERLALSEERLNLAIEGSRLALFDWDIPGNRIYHSAQAAALRGAPAIEATLTPDELRWYVHPDDLAQVLDAKRSAIKGDTGVYTAEYRVRSEAGGWIWLRSLGRVVERDANGRALRLAGTDADISERKLIEARLRQLAEYDHLTGLPNRALFYDRLQQAVQRALRSGRPMAVMFLDIDHFKRINDTQGHEAGDELLKSFAERLVAGVRKTDTVARLAGDEFTVILEELQHQDDACLVAEALVVSARVPVVLGTGELRITTSVGVAAWTQGEIDGAELLRRADAALYQAKRGGRDRWRVDGAWVAGREPDAA
jgi:diguanylate cyclase (GGDEF)-like protein/PAS domain S-box-containing protein